MLRFAEADLTPIGHHIFFGHELRFHFYSRLVGVSRNATVVCLEYHDLFKGIRSISFYRFIVDGIGAFDQMTSSLLKSLEEREGALLDDTAVSTNKIHL